MYGFYLPADLTGKESMIEKLDQDLNQGPPNLQPQVIKPS